MNERQHIALTEAQIIAAEKGKLQLETRDGKKIVQIVWFRHPYDQKSSDVLMAIFEDGESCCYPITGKRESLHSPCHDLFVSEPDAELEQPNDFMKVGEHKTFEGVEYVVCEDELPDDCAGCDLGEESCRLIKNIKCINTILKKVSPKPIYEVGEIIEHDTPSGWIDVEYREDRNDQVCVWSNGVYKSILSNNVRKKQKPRIYISGRITGIDYNEAFDLFEAAENELIVNGYEVINPMKVVPFNSDWSWFDYLSADIKLMEKCTHIYMLSNWRESGGASVEHEAAKWNNFAIIYQ